MVLCILGYACILPIWTILGHFELFGFLKGYLHSMGYFCAIHFI